MTKRSKSGTLVAYQATDAFEQHALAACFSISASLNTRKAYWGDVRHWLAFCRERDENPVKPRPIAVIAWIETMKTVAPKTRARRIAALSSVYDRLRRQQHVDDNPFSVENGPERERTPRAVAPTPLAAPADVSKIIATCSGKNLDDIRDAALIRILWATGVRRGALTSMTRGRLEKVREGFVATVVTKGNKELRVLVTRKAATALEAWLSELDRGGITKGGIWRLSTGAEMSEQDVWRMLRRRARVAGVTAKISPHMFRVSFVTINPAGIEAKQDAAGHADPKTTMLYDRTSWRGKEAFEKMPEPEDLEDL